MPRRPRCEIVVPGLPHHVIVRGNNKRNLFSYASCYVLFSRFLGEAIARFEVPLHCLVLMRNHVHLIVTPPSTGQLAGCVHRFAQRYAQRRNLARGGSGKLFEERYRAIPITSERQLAATMPYIELNPVRAGIVGAAADYPWSTYRLHADLPAASPEIAELWTPHPWWLALAPSDERRAVLYRDLTDRRLEAQQPIEASSRPYVLRDERPDRSRVAEAVDGEMRILPPDGSDYGDLGRCVLSPGPRMASRR